MIIMCEKNMRWGCKCTNWHACEYHKKVSLYLGTKDYGTLPVEHQKLESDKS